MPTPKNSEGEIVKMSLVKQCEALKLPLHKIDLAYNGKVEIALVKHFEQYGYTGAYIEGKAIFTTLKGYLLKVLTKFNHLNSKEDAAFRYLEASLSLTAEHINAYLQEIEDINRNTFVENMKYILNIPFIQKDCSGLTLEFAVAFFEALDRQVLKNLLLEILKNPYKYRNGWCDVTLIKAKKVRFIEVKTSDKLHDNQIFTIPKIRNILPYDFCIYKVKKIKDDETI
ncbi:hypothetical protein JHD47_07665 [Sulfurimonas sp. SAG-AH-194-L11]|nr:hypothetical protein [Sulfurimonas sp. SAG-AH-194-L11]MDF1877691.1 hypothetical protein [Sulfurimonas sp. SAG-AH-194-L11]